MIDSYAKRESLARAAGAAPEPKIARVVAKDEQGLTLRLPSGEITKKKCRCNRSVVFEVGDLVKITRVGGDIVAEYVVGTPL